ncbi:MAG: 3-oxoacyl-ACP synthase III family protein [Candidatus Margulisiibacteriota bacterium]
MSKLKEVELVSTGVYLPGDPVKFDEIEKVIGYLDDAPPRMKKLIEKLRPSMKELIGIDTCHFAVDPVTKKINESILTLATKASRRALQSANMDSQEVEAIIIATPVPEYQTPPISTLIQQELRIAKCQEFEIHSNCGGATKALQIGYDGIRLGRFKNALVLYSQLSSSFLINTYYNQAKIKPENLLLRWFLSDSAAAFVLKGHDKVENGMQILDVYNESVGLDWEPAMWMYLGAKNLNLQETYEKGLHHLGQDYNTVVNKSEYFFVNGFKRMAEQAEVDPKKLDYLIATIPSNKMLNQARSVFSKEFGLAPEKWFSAVREKGYSGGATIMIGLDDMLKKKMFTPGQLLACMTIESSKWMFGGFFLDYLK